MSDTAEAHAVEAANRLFRAYERHCRKPDPDTLFDTLNAMHSLNDRLKKATGDDFHKFEEFIALKALRNLTHHAEEVLANVRVVPAPGISDLSILCVVRRDQVERAISNSDKKWRESTKAACENVLHWYGPAVNINPCLFNFMVRAFEMLEEVGVTPADEAFETFEASYLLEAENGYSHFIDGHIVAGAEKIESVLSAIVADLPEP